MRAKTYQDLIPAAAETVMDDVPARWGCLSRLSSGT